MLGKSRGMEMTRFTRYSEWLEQIPDGIRGDLLWSMEVYRTALFAADISWHDLVPLQKVQGTRGLTDQLYRAVCSVSANIAEGYSKSGAKDRARFYEYALGSARESRDWYYKARHILGNEVTNHRLVELTSVIRLLITMIPRQRAAPNLRSDE